MSWLLYRAAFWVRETGQALDRLGCRLQGSNAFSEECKSCLSVFEFLALQLTSVSHAVVRHRTIMNLATQQPSLASEVFVAPSAAVIGNVSLGHKASVWYGCVLKGKCGLQLWHQDVHAYQALTECQHATLLQVMRAGSQLEVTPTYRTVLLCVLPPPTLAARCLTP